MVISLDTHDEVQAWRYCSALEALVVREDEVILALVPVPPGLLQAVQGLVEFGVCHAVLVGKPHGHLDPDGELEGRVQERGLNVDVVHIEPKVQGDSEDAAQGDNLEDRRVCLQEVDAVALK